MPSQQKTLGLASLHDDDDCDDDGDPRDISNISKKFNQANENFRKLSIQKPPVKYVAKPSLPNESDIFFRDCLEPEFKPRGDFELSSGACPFSPSESQELIGALSASESSGPSGRFARTRPRAEPPLTSNSGSCPSVSSSSPGPAFVEFCCGSESFLSTEAVKKGFHAIRFTKESHDIMSKEGFGKALNDIKSLVSEGRHIKLWASLPCQPWSVR